MSIIFGGHFFTDPEPLSTWKAPESSGLYTILARDVTYQPAPYRPLYFGETDNFAARRIGSSHEKHPSWLILAGKDSVLYVSISIMPFSTPLQRWVAEQGLIVTYRPPCNECDRA
jgi:hypothetical protein